VFELTGGALCLDFANTVYRRPSREPLECFTSCADVLRWNRQAGAHSERTLAQVSAWIESESDAERHSLLHAVRAFREDIFLVFSALSRKHPPPAEAVGRVFDLFADVYGRWTLECDPAGRWSWAPDKVGTATLLAPVARSAVELLLSPCLAEFKQCADADCAWLFVDTSRGHRRRWCDMRICGNRSKARRHSERVRRRRPGPSP
jgi:predicted RNA-binding Zn ribbon-like protein